MTCTNCGTACFGPICAYCKGETPRPAPSSEDLFTVTLPREVWDDIINARGVVMGSMGAKAISRLAEKLGATWDTRQWPEYADWDDMTPEEYKKEILGEFRAPVDEDCPDCHGLGEVHSTPRYEDPGDVRVYPCSRCTDDKDE